MNFVDTLAHEYGWSIEYIMSLPYAVVPGLIRAIAERHNRELAELILCIHPKDPQELFAKLTGTHEIKGKSLDELKEALAGVIPIEVRRRGSGRFGSNTKA
jgi:hypothetical protein